MARETREWLKCSESCPYFTDNYVKIYDATRAVWIPFKLWAKQVGALYQIQDERLVIILKARQLGMTWLCLSFILWLMLFKPAVTGLLFSRRDEEAQYLLDRMKEMYNRLPNWMQARRVQISNAHMWQLSNGSVAYGFPTTAGDSYTASVALIDEADLVPDLDRLLNAVKPTIDGGGRMIMLSRSDNADPTSTFKRMYKAARSGSSPWKSIFLPWDARPDRDAAWYEAQKQDVMSRDGVLDALYKQYPSTDEEALQAPTMDKRIPLAWLQKCFVPLESLTDNGLGLPGLRMYKEPEWFSRYVIGADPAEGNPTSDPSSLHVLEATTGEEVAMFTDRIQPVAFAETIRQISKYYNNAGVLVERNNHGHSVIGHLTENTDVDVLTGWDGAPGWHTTSRGKAQMWTVEVDALKNDQVIIHSESTFGELNSIDGATLRAPGVLHDDEAVSHALATLCVVGVEEKTVVYDYTSRRQVTFERR